MQSSRGGGGEKSFLDTADGRTDIKTPTGPSQLFERDVTVFSSNEWRIQLHNLQAGNANQLPDFP